MRLLSSTIRACRLRKPVPSITVCPNASSNGTILRLAVHNGSNRCKVTDAATRLGLIGQPTPETHPHLMKSGEVTPGLSREEYQSRRSRLMSQLSEGSVVIVPGYGLRYATNGIFYPFHQQTNLLYLCGVDEPDCALVLVRSKASENGYKMILFVRPQDKKREIWDGPKIGFEGAAQFFGADETQSIDALPRYIEAILSSPTGPIYTDLALSSPPATPLDETYIRHGSSSKLHASNASAIDTSITPILKNLTLTKGRRGRSPVVQKLTPLISELRLVKSPAEQELMRKAGRIAGRGFVDMMGETKPGIGEHDLGAVMEYSCKRQGAKGLGYVPVVAGGENALVIHYVVNNQLLSDGTLVLVDAGAEYAGYASDITRTWPVNGKFTTQQRQLYEAVLRVQQDCIKRCTGDNDVTLDSIQNDAFEMLREECSALFGRNIGRREMSQLYPHHVGHWLGMDIHDTENIPRTRKLEAGMVITIEPGLYIPHSDAYPEGFRGVGIRIEDDIVVGSKETGFAPVVLSAEAPKEVIDVEAVVGGLVGRRKIKYPQAPTRAGHG